MTWLKQNRPRLLLTVLIAALLAAAYWYGGNAPGLQGWRVTEGSPPAATADAQKDAQAPAAFIGPLAPEGPSDEARPSDAAETPAEESPSDQEKEFLASEPASQTDEGMETRPGGPSGDMSAQEKLTAAADLTAAAAPAPSESSMKYTALQGMVIDPAAQQDKYFTAPVPEGKPAPVEPRDAVIADVALTCTLTVRCDTILDNLDWLNPEKAELVPADGVIFATTTVTFYEGESVFNVLQREMKKAGIHMEFTNTPIYNSAYIEGIHNLYELDCGALSGWMYRVNGWFPSYGASRYQLREDDVIEWIYTCSLGVDVGGYSPGG